MLVLDFRQLGQHYFYQGDFVEFEVQFVPAPGALALLALGGGAVRGDGDDVVRFARSIHDSPTRANGCGNRSACLTFLGFKPILSLATGPL